MYWQGYNNLRSDVHPLISKADAYFASDYDKIIYLLNLGNDSTWKLVVKYIHLMFQKRHIFIYGSL